MDIRGMTGWIHYTPITESSYDLLERFGAQSSASLIWEQLLREDAAKDGLMVVDGSQKVWRKDGEPTFSMKGRPSGLKSWIDS